jgi:hypothetical protein
MPCKPWGLCVASVSAAATARWSEQALEPMAGAPLPPQ